MDVHSSDPNSVFPPKKILWPNLILASIAHALFVTRVPFLANEQSWDGMNYNVQNNQRSRGTIAFANNKDCFVGVFFLDTSERNPLTHGVLTTSPAFVRDLPNSLEPLYQEALKYVLQDVGGRSVPVITSAFWSDPDSVLISSGEPWHEVIHNGASLIDKQLLPIEASLVAWTNEFEFRPTEINLVEAIFKRRIAATTESILLSFPEVDQIRRMAKDEAGMQACRESFREIGINFPE